jgi:hypothetical protein
MKNNKKLSLWKINRKMWSFWVGGGREIEVSDVLGDGS